MSTEQALRERPSHPVGADPADIHEARAAILGVMPSTAIEIDRPLDARGEWFLDVANGDFALNIAWRPQLGFGLFTAEKGYGDRPNEVFRTPDLLAARVEQLYRQWRARHKVKPVTLGQLRQLRDLQQADVAALLSCKQSAVSRVENRDDVLIGTLQRHVRALGGRLEMRAHFPDFDVSLDLPTSPSDAT